MPLESPSPEPIQDQPESAESYRVPRRFGQYTLLQRLGRGGMGDVWLAKQKSIADIEKLCVVKTIRRAYTADREYVQRFIDEARTVVLLTHPNVCQVFDVGAVDATYYLAMEIVFGRNLRAVQERAEDMKRPIPQPIVFQIVSEILEALDYAHRLEHPKTGVPLGIVHRDVSPQNAIVSFEGDVKLIDFGLATSTLKAEHTEPGVVLGKLQYMAPEHARGDEVDRRADVFAVGVMLYELLSNERFYAGLSQDEVWRVAGRGYRPRGLDRLLSGAQMLIEHAIAPTLEDRYKSCAEFLEALHQVMIAEQLVSSTADVRRLMTELFPGEDAADRKERARLASLPVIEGSEPKNSVRFATSSITPGTDRVRKIESSTSKEAVAEREDLGPTEPAREPAPQFLADLVPSVTETETDPAPGGKTVPVREAFKLSDLPSIASRSEHSGTLVVTRGKTGSAPPQEKRGRLKVWIAVGVGLIAGGVIVALLLSLLRAEEGAPPVPPSAPVVVETPPAPVVVETPPAPVVVETPPAPVVETPRAPVVAPLPEPEIEIVPPEPPAATRPHKKSPAAPTPAPVAPVDVVLPPVPQLLGEKIHYLDGHCRARAPGCASRLIERYPLPANASAEEFRTYKGNVDQCLSICTQR